MKKKWKDPEFRAKRILAIKKGSGTLEAKENKSRASKKNWANPEYRKKHSEINKDRWEDSEYREKLSTVHKDRWEDPEFREKMIKSRQSLEYREKRVKLWEDPEFREKVSESIKRKWNNPEFRENRSGINHHNWVGGTSNYPYPFEFNDVLKMKIRDRDGCKCVLCGVLDDLQIHHINYDKEDSRLQNLITLCVSCHSKTNFNRESWEEFFSFNSFSKIF